jgi:hypothetical protein
MLSCVTAARTAAITIAVAAMIPLTGGAQTAKNVPRAADGHPNLQGTWVFTHRIPFEAPGGPTRRRPGETAENAGTADVAQRAVAEERAARQGAAVDTGLGTFYADRPATDPTEQRALVIDPPNGRVPIKQEALAAQQILLDHFYDSYWYWPSASRCITRGVPGTQLAGGVDSSVQIVQTRDNIGMVYEFLHETRLIPIGTTPHLPAAVRLWTGDSRGHWESDTLVVDVTNYNDKGSIHNSAAAGYLQGVRQSQALHVVERFTMVDADNIRYEVTIDDPNVYTRPWKAAVPMRREESYRLYEYACHEGNYGAAVALRAGRVADKTLSIAPDATRKAAEESLKK